MNNTKQKHTRRKLLVSVLRYTAFGAVGAMTAAAVRSRSNNKDGQCINNGICPQCVLYQDCCHPRALSTKKVLESNNGQG